MQEKPEIIEEVRKLILTFSEKHLTTEEEEICLRIWTKLTRKRKLDITKTRPDIWASAAIWAFGRANFKYEEGITLDAVSDFFKTKKSTTGNKAGEIIKMLNIRYFSPEFSTLKVLANNPLEELTSLTADAIDMSEDISLPLKQMDSKRRQAVEKLEKGLDLLESGDERAAGKLFFESVETDPTFADGYNHLANIVWRKGDWRQAESLYRKALSLAEPETQGIPAGHFWLALESRPYMRALHGMGLSLWKLNQLEEAAGIFEIMLKLNPNDNQGVRFLMGPIFHQMGKIEKAVVWYQSNTGDPHNLYNYGLVLAQPKASETGIQILIAAIFENPYIAPKLLKEKLPASDWWHGTNLAEPQYADDYLTEYRSWWEKEKSALELLRAIWNHGEIQRTLNEFINLRRAVLKTRDSSLITASERLISPPKIKILARKIYGVLAKDKTGQMDLK